MKLTAAVRGASVTVLAAIVPVPDNVAVCNAEASVSLTVSQPLRAPVVEGTKLTWMVQVFPAASELGQLLVCTKSPLAIMLTISRDVPVELAKVTACGSPVVFTNRVPKLSVPGDKVTEPPVTFRVVEPLIEPELAVMFVVPAPALVASPCVPAALLMVATVVTDEAHMAVVVRSCLVPSLKVPMAANC